MNSTKKDDIKFIKGGIFQDENGELRFANGFNFKKIKRFYHITLPRKKMIRAFHGHLEEAKSVFPLSGSLVLCVVKIDNKNTPSKESKVKKIKLDSKSPRLVLIPAGYANGIMSLEKNTSVLFLSDKTLEQSKKDDYRFSPGYWGKEVWQTE